MSYYKILTNTFSKLEDNFSASIENAFNFLASMFSHLRIQSIERVIHKNGIPVPLPIRTLDCKERLMENNKENQL